MKFDSTQNISSSSTDSVVRRRRDRLAWVALGVVLSALGPSTLGAAETATDFILVTVDTLRADALGCYGSPYDQTPNLDRLAARGTLFEDTITTIGKTGPATASMFTSLYPPTHGARRNGVAMRSDVPVLAETLSEAGYQTAAFISNWTLRSRLAAVHRGFDHYDERFDRRRNPVGAAERSAASVTKAALEWLDQERDSERPLFLWLHYSEPHTPYVRQEGFLPPKPDPSEGPGRLKRWRYASEVAYTDHMIGQLLDELETRLSKPLIAFLADHGESLGEHGYWGHGKNAHWPNLEIPFLLAGPGVPAGRRSSKPAAIIDLYPTITSLLGIEVPAALEGVDLFGISEKEGEQRARFAFADRHTAISQKAKEDFKNPLQIAFLSAGVKTLYDFTDRAVRYYDRRKDREENRPLAECPIDARPPFRRRLANWYRELPKYDGQNGELSEEDLRQLRSLGYVGAP